MKRYSFEEMLSQAVGVFLGSNVYILKIDYGIEDRLQVFNAAYSSDGHIFGRPSWCKVRYNLQGQAYIVHHRRRYYMSNSYRMN